MIRAVKLVQLVSLIKLQNQFPLLLGMDVVEAFLMFVWWCSISSVYQWLTFSV